MKVLSPSAALALVHGGRGPEQVGLFEGAPALVVALDDSQDTARLAEISAALPCVLVGTSPLPMPVAGFDVLLTEAVGAPKPWVSRPGESLAGAGRTVLDAVAASPEASIVLVQLLRTAERLEVGPALLVESFVYGLLQSGGRYRAWLDTERPQSRPRAVDSRPPLAVRRTDEGLEIVLDRPEVRNAYGVAMRDALVEALRLAAADPDLPAIHLRGNGPAFCSGGDLREFGTTPSPVIGHIVRSTRSTAQLLAELADRSTAHLHGACVGAGIELAAFCAQVLAAPDTVMRLPEVAMGLIPGAGGTVSISRRIGRHRLTWMAITGEWVDVQTALEWAWSTPSTRASRSPDVVTTSSSATRCPGLGGANRHSDRTAPRLSTEMKAGFRFSKKARRPSWKPGCDASSGDLYPLLSKSPAACSSQLSELAAGPTPTMPHCSRGRIRALDSRGPPQR